MPLIKSPSKKALKKNIETEMSANPSKEDRAQNLAVAFSVQRKNQRKKMAEGGKVSPTPTPDKAWSQKDKDDFSEGMNHGSPLFQKMKSAVGLAEGGEVCSHCSGSGKMIQQAEEAVEPPHAEPREGHEEKHNRSILDDVMSKHKMMAREVDEDEVEGPATDISHNIDAVDESIYDDSQLSEQPEDSNEHDVELDSDKHDSVSKIMRKMKKG